MDCQIYTSDSIIVNVGKKFDYVYLNYKNGIRVVNPFLGINITDLPEESFCGDYQTLLGINSIFDYVANVNDKNGSGPNTWCMLITSEKFIKLCD
jgi:hypothetical protein